MRDGMWVALLFFKDRVMFQFGGWMVSSEAENMQIIPVVYPFSFVIGTWWCGEREGGGSREREEVFWESFGVGFPNPLFS